ncbi:MAG: cytochrome c [Magnetovibrio sp.]|nr:cytochrome c [Magnetovibrio sp.]
MDGTGGNWIGAFLEPHARNLTNPKDTAHLDPKTLRTVISNGIRESSMPAWGSVFDPAQIDAVASYVTRVFLVSTKNKQPTVDKHRSKDD